MELLATRPEREPRDGTLDAHARGVERAVRLMTDCLGEPLAVEDLADSACMSRFHFIRVFSQITGASPGRFLAALRMQEAKRLLLRTDADITTVSLDVGYNSLGTFSRTFTDFVGLQPTRFRECARLLQSLTVADVTRFLPHAPHGDGRVSVRGVVEAPRPVATVVIAAFPSTLPRSVPTECACLTDSFQFAFRNPASASCRVFAMGVAAEATVEDALLGSADRTFLGASRSAAHDASELTRVALRTRAVTDPPLVLAFPLLCAGLGGSA